MQNTATLLASRDVKKSKRFYQEVMGFSIVMDLDEINVCFDKGVALQELNTWAEFVARPIDDICFGGGDCELVYEEDDFDGFIQKLDGFPEVKRVIPVTEYPWGQRVIRIADPDGHIIEVGENMQLVVRRFIESGMSPEEVGKRTMMPREYINMCMGGTEAEK